MISKEVSREVMLVGQVTWARSMVALIEAALEQEDDPDERDYAEMFLSKTKAFLLRKEAHLRQECPDMTQAEFAKYAAIAEKEQLITGLEKWDPEGSAH